jgi:hypothetical protein
MNAAKTGAVCLLALSIAGCGAPQPIAENFGVTHQKVARTAKHWEVVANDVASQTVDLLTKSNGLASRAFFIPTTTRNTAFDAAFRDFLINDFVDRGINVKICPAPEAMGTGFADLPQVKIRYTTRIIGHSEAQQYRPGLLTALAAGVFVGRSLGTVDLSRDAANGVALGLGLVGDIWGSHVTRATHTEIIVTTSIEENNRFLMRRADIYYVPDGDANLFVKRVATSSSCPGDSGTKATDDGVAANSIDADEAVTNLFNLNMKRVNANWEPPSLSGTFAY